MSRILNFALLVIFLPAFPRSACAEVGEFSIPAVSPLRPVELKRLRELVRDDAEAKELAAEIRRQAIPLLGVEPRSLPVIHYEGLVNTDPKRIATVKRLNQMAEVAWLVRYWQAFGDAKAAATLRRLILAWADRYQPTGNDVNENKFYPLLVAYEALRENVSGDDRQRVDPWVRRLGELHENAVKKSDHLTNRYSKSLRLLAIAGRILDRPDWVEAAHEGVKRFVRGSLHADGTSRDLKHRDSLTYHGSALRPPMELAILAGEGGRKLYAWTSANGGSLKKSVDFMVPYALGEKTRREWANTKVGLDRRRAEAGLEKYRPGRLYEPKDSLKVMELASYFDPSLLRVVRHLTDSEAKRFPTWQTLINEAARAQPATSNPIPSPE